MIWTIVVTAALTALVVVIALNFATPSKKLERKIEHRYPVSSPQFRREMGVMLGPSILHGNHVTDLENGVEIFPAMLEAIRGAQHTITFETYIYWEGDVGQWFADALSERARAGVEVNVTIDWVGSVSMDASQLKEMEDAGVNVQRYRPLHWYNLARMNNRTHRKLLVVDGRIGFTGGVGIGDPWQGNAQDADHWRDMHFRIEGPAVAQMQATFMDNWMKCRALVLHGEEYFPALAAAGDSAAQVFHSSPGEGAESVRLMYLLSIASARQSILLANSYFVPDSLAVQELVAARQRGVRVEIITPGAHIDTETVRKASKSRWGPLLEAGVEIYEYQPTMFHCKVMVVDGAWVSVGSTNFDNRSFRLNDEANLNVLDPAVAAEQAAVFEADKGRSHRVTLEAWRRRPASEKIKEKLAGLLRSQL